MRRPCGATYRNNQENGVGAGGAVEDADVRGPEGRLDKKELPTPEVGAMCYMMSKQGYLNDRAAGPWKPHVMFFVATTDPTSWGANLPSSPIFAAAGD